MTTRGRVLVRGDRVRLVSPASRPDDAWVDVMVGMIESWGLVPEVGDHAVDSLGHYLAGTDDDRLADLDAALRDPGVRAVITTIGGKGSYRIAHRVDVAAIRRDPKPIVGFSDITSVHLAIAHACDVATIHGHVCPELRSLLMSTEPITIDVDPDAASAVLTTSGRATGRLLGGNLTALAASVGWSCPDLRGAIVLLEAVEMHPGAMDRAMTQVVASGALDGVAGVVIGDLVRAAEISDGKWSFVEILGGHLAGLGVPILGGLPIGHRTDPRLVPLGTHAELDAGRGTLVVEAAVA
jgi:muramoyltetrapeptide carboxypeptidase